MRNAFIALLGVALVGAVLYSSLAGSPREAALREIGRRHRLDQTDIAGEQGGDARGVARQEAVAEQARQATAIEPVADRQRAAGAADGSAAWPVAPNANSAANEMTDSPIGVRLYLATVRTMSSSSSGPPDHNGSSRPVGC